MLKRADDFIKSGDLSSPGSRYGAPPSGRRERHSDLAGTFDPNVLERSVFGMPGTSRWRGFGTSGPRN